MNKEWREMTISEKKDLLVRQIESDVFDIHNHVCFLLNFCGLPQEKATELSNHYNEIEKIITEYSKKNFIVINDDVIEKLELAE